MPARIRRLTKGMIMLLRAMILLGLFAATLLPESAQAERRVALVIGNAAYANAASLRNPRNDANDFAESLKKMGFEVELGLDLDQQGFARTIENFARSLDGADVGLFFFAGHGLQMNEKNYLVSANARLESEFLLSSETIELDAIVRLMESKAPTNLVFLDACRNNPLAENLKRTLMSLKRSVALGRGLARVEPSGRDTLIAFAAAPGQEATDGADRNSPFTTALLQHMPKPGLEVSVMLKEVAADVRRDTRNSQRPQQLSDMTRPFYFVKAQTAAVIKVEPVATPELMAKPAPQAAAERPADDRALDVAFWNAAQSANDCDAVRAYMQRFPSGVFIELARLSERRLCVSNRKITVIDAPDPIKPAASTSQSMAASVLAPPANPSAAPSFTTPAAAATLPAPATTLAAMPAPVAAAPPPVKAAGPTPIELARITQLELYRVGCGTSGADGQWSKATRESLRRFSLAAKVKVDLEAPSELTIAALQKQPGRVCALVCGRGMQARGETCVATKQQPAKKQQRVRRQAPAEAAAAPPPAAPAAAPMMGPPMGGMIFFGRRRF
jgi:hypothetical protein